MRAFTVAAAVVLFYASCSTPPSSQAGKVQFGTTLNSGGNNTSGSKLTRAELEDAILRFEGRFNTLLSDAFRPLSQSPTNSLRRQATRLKLMYSSAALSIALGALPEQNLLDMVVYVELVHDVFRDFWLPKVFKAEGQPILSALEKASQDLEKMTAAFLTPSQFAELRQLVDAWHRRNPNIVAVETVRLPDFSAKAGARALQIESQISGLLAPISGATAAAERGLLLGERGLYYAQRAPFLLRMQSSAALQDILDETRSSISDLPISDSSLGQVQDLLVDSTETLSEAQGALRELQPIATEFRKLVDLAATNPQLLEGSANLLGNLAIVMKEYNQGQITDSSSTSKTSRPTDKFRDFLLGLVFGLLLSCGLLILFAGVVYVLAKLAYERFSVKRRMKERSQDKRKAA
jgi:hypothetical protein